MAKCKKFGDGGMLKGADAGVDNARRKLPSEDIADLEKAPQPNIIDRATTAVKGLGKRLKDNVMGTEKQNEEAQERLNKAGKFAKGGKVSSASSRGDGCAQRGKTRGRMV